MIHNNDQFDDFDPDSNYFDDLIADNHVSSSYNSMEDFYNNNPITLQEANYLSIFSQNIRSFNKNLDSFLLLFEEDNMPDAFVFSETWYDSFVPTIIPGYTGYHTVRDGRSGGVSVFIKSHINSEKFQNLCYANDSVEVCIIKVTNLTNSLSPFKKPSAGKSFAPLS